MSDQKLRDALAKIAELASKAVDSIDSTEKPSSGPGETSGTDSHENPSCTIKSLPHRLAKKAAEVAIMVNPVNAPVLGSVSQESIDIPEPLALAVVTSKYWGPTKRVLSVSFMESTPNDLKTRILSHMNAWNKTAGISFALTAGVGQVRISRGPGGYWSYLGTDILLIPSNKPTMNLQNFSMTTAESEYKRVVRHETGHTMGFPHEHMRKEIVALIDPAKAYVYFWNCCGWNKATVDAQVLTSLNDSTIFGTPPDKLSIMCYQLPGSITKNGQPIPGGSDIDATDYAFAGKIYPKPPSAKPSEQASAPQEGGWDENEDVDNNMIEQTAMSTLVHSDGVEEAV